MTPRNEEWFRPGLKFTSTTFASDAEIAAIREDRNEVDVLLISSENYAQKVTWNLEYTKKMFQQKQYNLKNPNAVNISVY